MYRVLVNRKNVFKVANLSYSTLKDKLSNIIVDKREEFNLLKNYSNTQIDKVNIGQVIGGMRGIKSMIWNISHLDSNSGIKFHDKSIDELRELLPKANVNKCKAARRQVARASAEPMAESLLWFLMTGNVPNKQESYNLSKELHDKSHISDEIKNMIVNLPKKMHPMTKLSTSILMLQKDSQFVKKYNEGINKEDYWLYTYEDIIDIIAKLPEICCLIYSNTFDKEINPYNSKVDYIANFCDMLGFTDKKFHDLMRLYILIHCDHEGGNASAHTCRLVGSTLSDPYLSFSASMNALAGPLHGLANQEVLKWLTNLKIKLDVTCHGLDDKTSKKILQKILRNDVKDKKLIPGYGHAVLRNTDPRFMCQREFALTNLPDDDMFKLVDNIYNVLPNILKNHSNVKNPYPNVDAHSGILLKHYGLNEHDFYTVLFGFSRAFGVLSQLLWDRALNLPIERPKSLTMDCIKSEIEKVNFDKH